MTSTPLKLTSRLFQSHFNLIFVGRNFKSSFAISFSFDRSGFGIAWTSVHFDLAIGITDEVSIGAIHGNHNSSVGQTNLDSYWKCKIGDFAILQLWDLSVPLDWIRVIDNSDPEEPVAEKDVSQYPSILMVPDNAVWALLAWTVPASHPDTWTLPLASVTKLLTSPSMVIVTAVLATPMLKVTSVKWHQKMLEN